jgi:hypothetical protein
MNSVVIKYRPFLLPFEIKINRKVPSGWNEINEKMMVTIVKYYNRTVSEDTLMIELFGFSKRMVQRLNNFYKFKLFDLFDFIAVFDASQDFVIKNLGDMKAPKAGLRGVKFGCFILGDTYFQDYIKDKKEEDLDRFIAAFYGGKDFDEDNFERTVAKVNKFPLETREAIVINYIMIKKWFVEKYKNLFKKTEEDTDDKKKPAVLKEKKVSGWLPIFDALVGDDIVNREKYFDLPVNEALRFLNNRIKNNRTHGH